MTNLSPLQLVNTAQQRGLSVDEAEQKVLDFFGGVTQQDLANDPSIADNLSRNDKIELLIDKQTPGVFGGSPWSPALQLDASVSNQIHLQNGGTLVFQINSTTFQAILDKVLPPVRYALVWDDAIIASEGTLDVPAVGQGLLVATVANEPTGQTLTLWVTDQFVQAKLVQQDSLANAAKVQSDINGKLGAAGQSSGNPITDALNTVSTFFTASTVGGLVALAIVGVALVFVVRSEAFKDVAATARKAA